MAGPLDIQKVERREYGMVDKLVGLTVVQKVKVMVAKKDFHLVYLLAVVKAATMVDKWEY